ncbi:MAG: TspO/MBR family protein [Acidiphilium sp.]
MVLLGFCALCLAVGISDSVMTIPNIRSWYDLLPHPPGTPPNGVFGPVWTVLYVAMAVAAWRVWQRPSHAAALQLWGWQLGVNALWSPVFFALHRPGLATFIILAMDALVALTIRAFTRHDRWAGLILMPYLAWGLFATYLTAGFWWLNP